MILNDLKKDLLKKIERKNCYPLEFNLFYYLSKMGKLFSNKKW